MKKSGKCPKCGTREIVLVPGKLVPAGNGRSIMLGHSALSSALIDRYICLECGYSEDYFDENELQKITDKFDKID